MTRTETVIERALAEVAKSQALRERTLAQRREMQARVEATTPRPIYVLKGRQMKLDLRPTSH